MPDEPTIFVVDDDPDVRKSLAALLTTAGYRAVTYASAETFLQDYNSELPGCIILDVRMPGEDGLDLQEQLAEQPNALPVIVVTGQADVPMTIRALKGGAVAFVEKPFDHNELLQQIEIAVRQDIQRRMKRRRLADLEGRMLLLTPREKQILRLVVDGKLSKQIASDLGISDRTVETHRAHIMTKLQVETIAELVALAVEYKMLTR